jgi:hypothetical protein
MNDANLDEKIAIPENSITRLTEEINALKAERENLKPNYKNNKRGLIISLVVTLSYCLFTFFFIYLMETQDLDTTGAVLCFFPGIIAAVVLGVFILIYLIKKAKFNKQITHLNNTIAEKEKELKRNQDVVNGK